MTTVAWLNSFFVYAFSDYVGLQIKQFGEVTPSPEKSSPFPPPSAHFSKIGNPASRLPAP
jgi:hypothetical protein